MNDGELTVGVLGGMGPEATIDFMTDVLNLTRADKDQDHLHLVVDQNPKVPNRQAAIRAGTDDVGRALAAMAARLARAGADFLVMPCNSAHAFERAIREATALPFVSIVEVCVEAIQGLGPLLLRVARSSAQPVEHAHAPSFRQRTGFPCGGSEKPARGWQQARAVGRIRP